jgi:hypothetical protein
MKRLLLLLLAVLPIGAQTYTYTASQTTVLAAAAEVVTIQAPGTAGSSIARLITLAGVSLNCSVACTINVERDGTAATTTAITAVPLNRLFPPAEAQVFKSSNVGAGTVVASYPIAAGGTLSLDFTGKALSTGADNLTFRTNSITGTVVINAKWTEN